MASDIVIGDFGTAEDSTSYKPNWSFEGIIRKIIIKTRPWRATTIVQGFQVHLDSGFSHAYGMSYNDIKDVTCLEVPPGLQIDMVQVRSDVYINALAFILNDGQILGPVGEQSAGQLQDIASRLPKGNQVLYLSGISGSTARSYKAPCVCQLKFKFRPK